MPIILFDTWTIAPARSLIRRRWIIEVDEANTLARNQNEKCEWSKTSIECLEETCVSYSGSSEILDGRRRVAECRSFHSKMIEVLA